MDISNKRLIQLTSLYNKFRFHRTLLFLCELYFAYTYAVDFPTGSLPYRVIMGSILLGIALLAFYAHRKMGILQEKIKKEKQDNAI